MIQRMQRASAILDDLAFQSMSGRLAHLLLKHFDTAGEQAIGALSVKLTPEDVAYLEEPYVPHRIVGHL
jgi:hypothetical protein